MNNFKIPGRDLTNLKYNQDHHTPCKFHYVSDIYIYHDIQNLEISYFFNLNNWNLIWGIFYTDCINLEIEHTSIEIQINNKAINSEIIFDFNNEYAENSNNQDYYPNEEKYIKYINSNLLLNQADNTLKIKFLKGGSTEDLIQIFLWFMSLVRYITDENEEDDFFMEKEIKRRRECYNYNDLYQKLIKMHS